MHWIDIAIVAVLVVSAIEGWRSGVFVFGWLGIALGSEFGLSLGNPITNHYRHADWVGFGVIFALAVIVGSIVGAWLQGLVDFVGLSWLDSIGGVLASLGMAVIAMAVMLNVGASSYAPHWSQKAVGDSSLAPSIMSHATFVIDKMPQDLQHPPVNV